MAKMLVGKQNIIDLALDKNIDIDDGFGMEDVEDFQQETKAG